LSLWVTWEWFRDLGYESILWTQWQARAALFGIGWGAALLFLGLNAFLAARAAGRSPRLWLGLAAAVGFLFGLALQGEWERVLLALNAEPFGVRDPLFGLDVGWYVFRWPLWVSLQETAQWGLVPSRRPLPAGPPRSRGGGDGPHLSILAALFFLLMAVGYRFDAYRLLYAERPVAFGAGYAEVHARLPVLNLLSGLMVLLAAGMLLNLRLRRPALLALGFGVWLALAFLGLEVYPGLIQTLVVRPNELARESPYIAHSIAFTRRAYGLEGFNEQIFSPREAPTPEEIRANAEILEGIRLWDYRPLLQTLQQLQSIRPYYVFVDVDVDRYRIDGAYRQVMLSVRELDLDALPPQARTWVNRHLVFTHGYGVVVVPVRAFTPEGLPVFLLKGHPAGGRHPPDPPADLLRGADGGLRPGEHRRAGVRLSPRGGERHHDVSGPHRHPPGRAGAAGPLRPLLRGPQSDPERRPHCREPHPVLAGHPHPAPHPGSLPALRSGPLRGDPGRSDRLGGGRVYVDGSLPV
jgi:uncharacterized membrane protein (UPF0182 family)